jgi:hypothetical protein
VNIPEPLRDNPFRFRKRRSLHSTLFGEGRERLPEALDNGRGYGQIPTPAVQSSSPKTYMSDQPDEYAPHVGTMQTSNDDYLPYDASEMQNMPKLGHQRFSDEFRMAAMELAGLKLPGTEDGLMDKDFFEQQLELFYREHDELGRMAFDTNEIAHKVFAAHKGEQVTGLDTSIDENMRDIRTAIEEARTGFVPNLDPEPPQKSLYGADLMMYESVASIAAEPADLTPRDFFEHLKQTFEVLLQEAQPAMLDCGAQIEAAFDAETAMLDSPQSGPLDLEQAVEHAMDDMGLSEAPDAQSLEQIIEGEEIQPEVAMAGDTTEAPGYDDDLMTPELFEQQMAEAEGQMEPYPEPLQQNYGMMPQEMYDEQMMYGMDPLMMPYGPMPFGPMMGPGPSGP